jgi:hypothetical protein
MSTKSRAKDLDRVVELWPSLSDEARADIVDIVEGAVGQLTMRPLTTRELMMIEKSREDFKHGRTMTGDEVGKYFDAYFKGLAEKAAE